MKMKRNDLIYDIGMHKGEDSAYYLKKGFHVVAIEANPQLVELCSKKFAGEIKNRQLTIINGAISDAAGSGNKFVPFYINRQCSEWGTTVNSWVKRNENRGTSSEKIQVPVIDFSKVLQSYGIPYYMKIDIEGMDTLCLQTLLNFKEKPDFISIESDKVSFQKLKDEIALFNKLGYNKFKAVNQSAVERLKEPLNTHEGNFLNYKFTYGSSGPFGRDLPDKWVKNRWIIFKYRLIFLGYKYYGDHSKVKKKLAFRILYKILQKIVRQPIPGWYDTHAKHASVE